METILSIAGKPGLYKLVNRGNRNLIVEAIDATHRRMPAFASADELHAFFAEVLPAYDRDRVHDSDIKKLIQWYNILVNNGITDFETALAPTEGDNVDDRQEAE
mgnify:CR=1 FL=1